MNKMFEEVKELDQRINKAYEDGDYELEQKLVERQDEIVNAIAEDGLSEEFDKFIQE